MPADAAGMVWLRQCGRDLDIGTSRQGYAVPERALSRVAVLPHAFVEHGHGAGQELDRDRLALRRTGAGHETARKYLRTHPPGMASLDRDAIGHHGAGPFAAEQSAAGALNPQPLSLSRSAQP